MQPKAIMKGVIETLNELDTVSYIFVYIDCLIHSRCVDICSEVTKF